MVSLASAAGVVAFGVPAMTGAPWSGIGDALRTVTTAQLVALTSVWLAGLFAHTFVMKAALPRLTHRQALTLNFGGSAVSNLVPFGGALGMGLNYSMLRSWGFNRASFAVLTAVTNAWVLAVKLTLPAVAVAVLVATDGLPSGRLVVTAVIAMAALGVLAVVALLLGRSSLGRRGGETLSEVAAAAVAAWRKRWAVMAAGTVASTLLQALLLYLCLRMLGSGVGPVAVLAGYATGRALSLLLITPAGVGVSETGSAAVLVALGGGPAATTAAVLLFSTFTFAMEIPVGAAATALWWFRTRSGGRTPAEP
jgi:uncharacterized membrane protein YbhN (UPF0104 family)